MVLLTWAIGPQRPRYESGAPERIVSMAAAMTLRGRRIALTEALIHEHDLPGFDVDSKQKDGRYKW